MVSVAHMSREQPLMPSALRLNCATWLVNCFLLIFDHVFNHTFPLTCLYTGGVELIRWNACSLTTLKWRKVLINVCEAQKAHPGGLTFPVLSKVSNFPVTSGLERDGSRRTDSFHLIVRYCYEEILIQRERNYIYYSRTECCKPLVMLITSSFLPKWRLESAVSFLSFLCAYYLIFFWSLWLFPRWKMNNNCCPTAYKVCRAEE